MAKVCVLGVDAAKGKSTVCLIDEYGEVLLSPEDVAHTRKDLDDLDEKLKKAGRKEDMKVVMEATGIYHWPVFDYLEKKGYFISVINPLKMKLFSRTCNFRGVKTDKSDSRIIALYGITNYGFLKRSRRETDIREKLRRLSRAYVSYQKSKIELVQNLDQELEKMMPGIKKLIISDDKLYDFTEYFLHFDNISGLSERKFMERFERFSKKKNHRSHSCTPVKIYQLAKSAIPTIPFDDVSRLTLISLISSIRTINEGLKNIISAMNSLAKSLPEYDTVMAMSGVGGILGPLIIAEIGDIRTYRNKKSLVCAAGIDVPPYESGQFKATRRTITKKGNKYLRRHLYLVMRSILQSKPEKDPAVYEFMVRKKEENKYPKQVKVAGMRKFLHIYYARVKQSYIEAGIWNME
ncbi:MAG: IS110 family transposase [Erysipelotrichaceae bacterium]|nr:IS110 family transposase [Erysipelotrichaceae bacterium]MBQ1566796.1 IS110 family transposase [Erysipelotrichaceae bacterium]